MEQKEIIISTDVGFNGIKCIVGEPEKELFNFHVYSDIYDITDFPSLYNNELADTVYVKELAEGVNRTYATGKIARDYLQTRDAKQAIESDDFYYSGDTEEEDYRRFTTKGFKRLHLSVIFRAIKTLSEINGYEDVIDKPENYKLLIEIELPHAISKDNKYSSLIAGNIKRPDNTLSYKLPNERNYFKMPQIVMDAEVSFTSQVIAAVICEMESNEDFQPPVFVLDCGSKTVGIATIEPTFTVARGATSNRSYAVNNINKAVVKEVEKLTHGEYLINVNQIEELAKSIDGKEAAYWSDKNDKKMVINITEIYDEKANETAKALVKYCFSEYKHDLARSKTILVAGGTGVIYYKTLSKEFPQKLDGVNVVLAKGDIAGTTNGSIFSIAAGGFKLAAMKCLERRQRN